MMTSARSSPLIARAHLPERGDEAHAGEDPHGLLRVAPTERGTHAVAVPCVRERPDSRQGERLAAWLASLPAPRIDILFRPEERDRRSGVDQVVVPAAERQREMHDARAVP